VDAGTGIGSFKYDNDFFKNSWDNVTIKMPTKNAEKRIFTF
jgi:hypothetical protein